MGFFLVLAVLSLAIFVCISNAVFSLVARTRTKTSSLGAPNKGVTH
jgi:hypothetical protein